MVQKKKTSRTISKTSIKKKKSVETNRKLGVKLTHHRHTGKPVHIRYTSYAVLYFLLVLTGSTIFFASNAVKATDQTVNGAVTVSGRMKGPVPPNPATILEPTNGTHTTNNTTVIRGSCQAGLYIELFRYSTFAGSTFCGNSGEFQLSATLKRGQNDFKIRMSDADNQYAPDSSIVTVFYDIPQVAPGAVGSRASALTPNGQNAQNVQDSLKYEPLIVTTSLKKEAYPINKNGTLQYEIIGGLPAYAVLINWDDGSQNDLRSIDKAGKQSIIHKFTKSGQHVVTITVSDQLNNKASVQTVVNVTKEYSGVASVISPSCVLGSSQYFSNECYVNNRAAQIIDSVWPALIVATLMTTSFWFGERVIYARTLVRRKH